MSVETGAITRKEIDEFVISESEMDQIEALIHQVEQHATEMRLRIESYKADLENLVREEAQPQDPAWGFGGSAFAEYRGPWEVASFDQETGVLGIRNGLVYQGSSIGQSQYKQYVTMEGPGEWWVYHTIWVDGTTLKLGPLATSRTIELNDLTTKKSWMPIARLVLSAQGQITDWERMQWGDEWRGLRVYYSDCPDLNPNVIVPFVYNTEKSYVPLWEIQAPLSSPTDSTVLEETLDKLLEMMAEFYLDGMQTFTGQPYTSSPDPADDREITCTFRSGFLTNISDPGP